MNTTVQLEKDPVQTRRMAPATTPRTPVRMAAPPPTPAGPPAPGAFDLPAFKARQKMIWESGDFGQVARHIEEAAVEFIDHLPLRPGMRVLDAACGSGNLAMVTARRGLASSGVDIATNLLAQARQRAAAEGRNVDFREGDVEDLPYADGSFDAVVTMFGAMFAPRPERVAAELFRVTRPGGFIAMANWTPEGFIGKMFSVFKAHLPPPPAAVPSTMLWGHEPTVRERLKAFGTVRCARHLAVMRFPFPPAETVNFFRRYYGPTGRAFDALGPEAQAALQRDLVQLQAQHNTAPSEQTTEARAEYLEVIAFRDHAA